MAEDTTTPGAEAPKEPTVAELNKQLTAVTKERDTHAAKLEKVTAERDAHKQTIAEQKQTIADQAKEHKQAIADQAKELQQAEAVIEEQTQKLAVADAKGGDAVIVSHEKKQYRVIGKQVNVDGHVHTAESLTKNPDVVAQLVRSESGFLQLVRK